MDHLLEQRTSDQQLVIGPLAHGLTVLQDHDLVHIRNQRHIVGDKQDRLAAEHTELYIRLAFQYESSIDALLTKGLIDTDLAAATKEKFYDSLNEEKLRTAKKIRDYHETIRLYMRKMTCNDMMSLTELARQHSEEPPGYVIQSWMRSRNTLEFLRQWENDMNEEFDDRACEELIHQGHTTSLTITPSLWIRRTHAVGMYVKQGKGGGVSAYPEIAADFHLWLDPKARFAIVRKHM